MGFAVTCVEVRAKLGRIMTKANGIPVIWTNVRVRAGLRSAPTRVILALAALAYLLSAMFYAPAAQAQGPGPGPGQGQAGPFVPVEESDAGGYHVKVWQSPERLVVSSVQVIVELTDATTGEVIDDAVIKVYGTPSEEGQRQVSPALNSPVTPKYYQANIVLDHPGLWAFDVDIEGPLGDQRVTYSSEVHQRSRAGTSLFLGTLMFTLVGAAFVGGIAYLWWSGRRNRRQLSSQRS
jgi:hypothetical protein